MKHGHRNLGGAAGYLLCGAALLSLSCSKGSFRDKVWPDGTSDVTGADQGADKQQSDNATGEDATPKKATVKDATTKTSTRVSRPTSDGGAKVAVACADAKAKGSLRMLTKNIFFPAATSTCQWEQNGNGPAAEDHIRARVEQYVSLDLPKDARFCDMAFDFPEQDMKYDDEILLLLQDYVLMSSTNYQVSSAYPNGLLSDEGFVKYAWTGDHGLYDISYFHEVTPVYCLGTDNASPDASKSCLIPPTEVSGRMKLVVPQAQVMALSAKVGLKSDAQTTGDDQWKMGFVTLGDNNPETDCMHTDFRFAVTVKYVSDK